MMSRHPKNREKWSSVTVSPQFVSKLKRAAVYCVAKWLWRVVHGHVFNVCRDKCSAVISAERLSSVQTTNVRTPNERAKYLRRRQYV